MASPRNEPSNVALHAMEFSYARLLEIEALLKVLLNNTGLGQVDRTRIQAARLAASRGRERIVEAHPKAPKKATKW